MARNLGTSVRNSAIVKVAPVIFEPGAIRTRSKAKAVLNQPHLQNSLAQTRTERRLISFKTQREASQNKAVGKKIADVGCVPVAVAVAASSFKPSMCKPPLPKNKEQVLVPRAIQTSCYDGQKVAKAQAQASTKVGAGNRAFQANVNANAKQPTLNSSLKAQTNSLPPSQEWFTNTFRQGMPHRDSENKGFMKGLGRPCPPSDIVPSSKLKSVAHIKKNQNQNKVKPDDRCPPAPRKCKARSRLEHVLDSTKYFQEKTHSVRHGHQSTEYESESWTEFSTPEKQMVSYHHISCPQAPTKGELLSHFDGLEVSPLCKTLSFDDNVFSNAIMCAPALKMVTEVDQNIRKVIVSQSGTVQTSFLPVKKEDKFKPDKSLETEEKFEGHQKLSKSVYTSESFLDDVKAAMPTPISKAGRIVEVYRQLDCFKSVRLRLVLLRGFLEEL